MKKVLGGETGKNQNSDVLQRPKTWEVSRRVSRKLIG